MRVGPGWARGIGMGAWNQAGHMLGWDELRCAGGPSRYFFTFAQIMTMRQLRIYRCGQARAVIFILSYM